MNRKARVFVMLSGGVDSAVAALLLRDQGYDVTGVFMKNWSPNTLQSLTDCPWEQDLADAEAVAKHLGITFRSVNFEQEYRQEVVDYFLAEYRAGRTPNPDILCNQKIKFGAFYRWALNEGADLVASGHYARIDERGGRKLIARGLDKEKDQSYFLWAVDPAVLTKVRLPVGELTKKEVRAIALANEIPVATKKDSQGICFIGHLNVGRFLRQELGVKPGEVVLKSGTVVGEHDGYYLYTIGQRHGFKLQDTAALCRELDINKGELPTLYVVEKDAVHNRLIVDNRQPIARHEFMVDDCRWYLPVLAGQAKGETAKLDCQVRYRQVATPVEVASTTAFEDNSRVSVRPGKPITAVTEGQFAVFYHQDAIVGGGVIV